jgi:hypothetical protein
MGGALEKYVGLWLVFASGLLAGIYGFVMLLLEHHVGSAAAEAIGGLGLIAWVIFHPARAPERAGIEP